MGRFGTLGQKKFALTVDPLAIVAPPISQVPLSAPDPVMILSTRAGVKPSSLEAPLKFKGREPVAGSSKKFKKKMGRPSTISERMKEYSTEIKKVQKKISSLEKQAKLDLQVAEKDRLKLAAIVQESDDSNAALANLCPGIFQDGWLAGLKEFDVTPKHQLGRRLPCSRARGLSQAYSPLMFLSFNEEEMPEELDKILEKSPGVVGELDQETSEVEEDDASTLADGTIAADDGVAAEGTSHTCPQICNNFHSSKRALVL
ncbi:hypothetical protein Acr_27g0001560 [Actinidia rufa]|uniref:Uncharacterized protein n=1 Tax=Actinidia rufa TaxID=165716 RepID=A0A7J0H5N6_9ERIC|nr:hypothetical protein Acr_27g0001560 [Actinidia rufa]